ncbi:Hypothetical protein A7982_04276 [Minicystis rosea]|nr:Hypothetical protein A7982_04276 [Minicystis rosea]
METAYCLRLAGVVVLLVPAAVLVLGMTLPSRGFDGGMPPRITFSSPLEYLPVLVLATVVVTMNAPTNARLLGGVLFQRERVNEPASSATS